MAFWDCVVCVCMASDATGRQSVMWICRSNSGLGHGTNNFPPHLSQHAKIVNHDDLLRTPYIKHNANFCINQTMSTNKVSNNSEILLFLIQKTDQSPKTGQQRICKEPYSNTIKERIASRCYGETYNKGNDARESRKRDLYRYPYPYPYISHPMTWFSPVSYSFSESDQESNRHVQRK